MATRHPQSERKTLYVITDRGRPDAYVAADFPAQLLQALSKCGAIGLTDRIVRRHGHQDAEAAHVAGLLCERRQRPCGG